MPAASHPKPHVVYRLTDGTARVERRFATWLEAYDWYTAQPSVNNRHMAYRNK